MGNFVQSGVIKTAVRELATPIADVTAFAEVVDDVVTNNPFGCTAYQVGQREPLPAVEKTREAYTARIIYEDDEAQTVGTVSAKCPTVAAYTANVATVLANAALASAMGGTAAHATDSDSFSADAPLPRRERRGLHGHVRPRRRSRSRRTPTTRSSRPSRPGPTPCRRSRSDPYRNRRGTDCPRRPGAVTVPGPGRPGGSRAPVDEHTRGRGCQPAEGGDLPSPAVPSRTRPAPWIRRLFSKKSYMPEAIGTVHRCVRAGGSAVPVIGRRAGTEKETETLRFVKREK